MTSAMLIQYGVPALLAVVSAVAGHWYGKRSAAGKSTPVANAVNTAKADVLSHPAVLTFAHKLIQASQASQHAALDAVLAQWFPSSSPTIPLINAALDAVEKKV